MKEIARILTLAVPLACAAVAFAQEDSELGTEQQKASYALGIQVAQSLIRQGIQLDTKAFSLAVEDTVGGKQPRISPEQLQTALQSMEQQSQKHMQEAAEKNLKEGKDFLEANKSKEGVKVLPSGLQYKVLKEGTGKTPTATDTVSVHYTGRLINGNEFDSSERRGEPASLTLGNVIQGWQEALPLMKEGDKWQIYVPSELAYGQRGAGAVIGPNSTLVFDIELLKVM